MEKWLLRKKKLWFEADLLWIYVCQILWVYTSELNQERKVLEPNRPLISTSQAKIRNVSVGNFEILLSLSL